MGFFKERVCIIRNKIIVASAGGPDYWGGLTGWVNDIADGKFKKAFDTFAKFTTESGPGGIASTPFIGSVGTAVRFTDNQQALIQLAKEAGKKGGVTLQEAEILKEWAKEYNLPFRGPEIHPNRNFNIPHIHLGPINHLPVKY